ncbi:MAG: hypothetical protein F4X95_03475, partial [Oligoflexia bacterium]|nr:hypothetical protein [Oligoflexia bacterium]
MKNYFFSLLVLFFSACSPDSELRKSADPASHRVITKSSYQNKRSYFILNKEIKTSGDVNEDTTNMDVAVEASIDTIGVNIEEASTSSDVEAGVNIGAVGVDVGVGTDASLDVEASVSTSVENLEKNLEAVSSVFSQKLEISGNDARANNIDMSVSIVTNDIDAGVSVSADGVASIGVDDAGAGDINVDTSTDVGVFVNVDRDTDADTNPDAEVGVNTGANGDANVSADVNIDSETGVNEGINTVKQTDDNGFYVKAPLTQREICPEFSQVHWTNPGLSIEQSVEHFTEQQIQNLLGINREFPSPKDKEASVRCFVKTAFSLNRILKIATGSWWEGGPVPLPVSHAETLIGFMEHYFVTWVGYGLLSRIKSISSDHIDYILEDLRLLKGGSYKVSTKFTIMRSYSAKIIWIVDAPSVSRELAFI